MVQRLDPTIIFHKRVGSEDDRMKLLNGIVSEVAIRFDLYLDIENLYSADDRAVNELVKIASIIDKALSLAEDTSNSSDDEIQIKNMIEAAKRAKSLVDEITEICSRLSNVLEKECEDSKDRANALKFLNAISGNKTSVRDHCSSIISHNLEMTNSLVERLDKQCKILISNQHGMEEKIQKKSIDLERTLNRLESLKHVRPAYMDDYEKLEKDLQVEYERYVVRLRNKDYLVGELSSFHHAAIERRNKSARSMRRMQHKFREDELRILNGFDENESTT